MSRDWTREELNAASEMMKQNGEMGFEEFCHALEQKQPVGFELRDRERKELVKDISEILGEKAEYMRMPTCAYRIGDYTIAKDASLTWSADTADSDAELLLQKLADKGWQASILISRESQEGIQVESQSNDEEIPEPEVKAETAISTEVSTDAEADTYDFCIELPEETLTDAARANLDRIIESKGNLLRKALGTEQLTYEIERQEGSKVPVAVWEVSAADELRLDQYEGYPVFYYKKGMPITFKGLQTGRKRNREAFVYIMHEDQLLGIPSVRYLETCLEGYRFFGFDDRILRKAMDDSWEGL